MSAITNIIPEFILLEAINIGLKYIKQDLEDNSADLTQSYLHRILQGQNIERYNHFDQAVSILTKEEDDPRLLAIDLMYNMNFEKVPSIYVTLSGEQHGQNNIAIEEESEVIYNGGDPENPTSYNKIYTRRKQANYSVYIISDNSNEANLLYHILDCIILSMTTHLNLKGLYNLTQGGQDVQIDSDKVPKHIFIKTLSLGLQYQRSAPDFAEIPIVTQMMFTGIPTE